MAFVLRDADRSKISAADLVIRELRELADLKWAEGAAHFGIHSKHVLGIRVPQLRALARAIGTDHALAVQLWETEIMEARILTSLIADPAVLTSEQMDYWAGGFDSWAVCDALCYNLFDRTSLGWKKAVAWSRRDEEFVKRAAFATMAGLAAHDKQAADAKFLRFLPLIEKASGDDRNFVRKAVSWALRGIGKRNPALNSAAVETAVQIRSNGTPSGRWIAADALRELQGDAVQRRLFKGLA